MLRQLVIRDYLLVRNISLDFSGGLTVLTGETGAGKSMVLGALDVLLGERFPRESVAAGADRAVIEGTFVLKRPEMLAGLMDAEDLDGSGELLIRREISRQGRTRSWLNDHPLPLESVLKVREGLADFHGQREHQSLFKPARQLEYLDAFANCTTLSAQVSELHAERVNRKKQLDEARARLSAHRKDRVLLEYQFEEIERLGLKAGEEEAIEARLTKLESAEKLAADAARLLDLVSEATPSLVELSGLARMVATGIAKVDREVEPIVNDLSDVTSRLKDLANQIRHYLESLSFDDAELAKLRERRGVIWELRRKHGLTVEQILERAGELKSLLEQGEALEEKCAQYEADLAKADDALVDSARRLSKQRQAAAREFGDNVVEALKPMGFAEPRFEVSVQSLPEPLEAEKITADGADRVDYLFSANPGSKLVPIREVASGGESSRVTLAIKSVLSEKAEYPLLVYDEIDMGISGRVADQVGKALAGLARRHQVLVITHLPQIASRADHHLAVYKSSRGDSTETTARFLTGEQRVQAIAGLIAGSKITDKSLASASELLRQSGKLKTLTSDLG